jgi:prenyltransferase beta subunit
MRAVELIDKVRNQYDEGRTDLSLFQILSTISDYERKWILYFETKKMWVSWKILSCTHQDAGNEGAERGEV